MRCVEEHVAKSLMDEGYLAISDLANDASIALGGSRNFDIYENAWLVTNDLLFPPEHPPFNYNYWPVELVSPPLDYNMSSFQSVDKVVNHITNKYRTEVNDSCGYHVHVSANRQTGFSFEHLQKVMILIWSFEAQLNELHPNRAGNGFCRELTQACQLSKRMVVDELTPTQGLDLLLNARNVNEVVFLMTIVGLDFPAYDISNLREEYIDESGMLIPAAQKTKKTIEFRQHEGTLDQKRIYQWARFCTGLVEFSYRIRLFTLADICKQHVCPTGPNFTLPQVLHAAGWHELAEIFENILNNSN